ncbi:sel1 repeat family protein [Rhodoblastus acidophilus]|uniref:Sel1 repeat family protein n=1 Tax=Candidatus Rhodoblastus alkanivorans TaxID=2954117 RepID=A0ABS9Z854_9HYPH|nr:sel1 repeat family protein [Candidatus Rhodoblastus alkanivorans]MCI4677954.1 sel1 repeat family protein [Candidatus Rhodoblastus alkanivorans]MCI4683849.1 sel1 repeat family protein [Candidatus Rhodoblastus alkanivorans]MDI4641167.1 sel1 repeat family protein [Rhodoblastus acidophilus]
MKFAFTFLALCLAGAPAVAAEAAAKSPAPDEQTGELNPQNMSVQYWAAKATDDDYDPHMCMYGVFLDKTGQHEEARRIFKHCAEHGNLNAMPWMSYMEENGFDRPSDPVKAAEWDKKLADAGSSLGQFNYGLDLLRGHGVMRDRAAGKALIDKAAEGGDTTARELAQHDYDPDLVTPTADLAHYRQPQF